MTAHLALRACETIRLRPTAPFNFDATLHKPDHFPSADTAWEPGIRWQTMRWRGLPLGLKLEGRGTCDRPSIRLSVWSQRRLAPAFLRDLRKEITYRYGLRLDLAGFYDACSGDPQLGPIIRRWRGMRPACYSSLYEYLIIAIVLQNATVRRSVNMLQALLERCGTRLAYDGRQLYCMWEPAALAAATEGELRALKVGYRAKSFLRVTAAFAEGGMDEFALRRRARAEQRAALLGLYGIGPASVGYVLSDVFHHLDEFEHISPWEQKIYSVLFCGRDPDDPAPAGELLQLFEQRFGRYKMLAVHYVWEDLFWRRRHEPVEWLEKLIRL
jgi:3-methyladenine DNA glycosylase/8-oxoguanine DNA glycosylase